MRGPRRDSRLVARYVGPTFGAATTPRARPGTGAEARHGRHRLQRCANRAEAGLLRQAWVVSLALLVGSIVAGCAGGPKVSQPGDVASSVAPPAPVEDGSPPPRPAEPGRAWTNSIGMEFVWIPAGSFLMGSPESEAGRHSDERQHEVRISRGYWLGKYEVTQGEWEAVMGTNPSKFSECGSRCPVEQVSWANTQAFIWRLNERESRSGHRYRLPSEAEWEYAARAASTGATPEGDLRILGENNAPVLDGQEWYAGNSGVSYAGALDCSDWEERQYRAERCGSHAVGQKRGNGWGLHDMLGNVSEWTADWYLEYQLGPATDPRISAAKSVGYMVVRGGSWFSSAIYVRSAYREMARSSTRASTIGVRLVMTESGDVASSVVPPVPVEGGSLPLRSVEPGREWTNSLGMEFVWIPAGTFMIDSSEGDEGPDSNELQREVRNRKGFWMGKYEVTQGQWAALMGGSMSSFEDCGPRCPVEGVGWPIPGEFIAELNELEFGRGYRYRLPTSAEWTYAALAGTSGPRAAELEEISWYSQNSGWTTHPVGMKRPNAWGLHDMLGNVWEWVLPDGNEPTGIVGISGGDYRSGSVGVWYQRWEEYPPQRVLDDFSPIPTAGLRLVRTE